MAKHGENIRKRRDGRWEGRYIKGRRPDGTALWGYVYSRSYQNVRKMLLARKAESAYYSLTTENPTFEELGRIWLASLNDSIKPSTKAHYRYTMERYLFPVFGNAPIKSLDERRLEQGLSQVFRPHNLQHKPLGRSMARECLILTRRICKYACHLRMMRPVQLEVALPQGTPTQTVPLSEEEQEKVCSFVMRAPTPRKIGLLLGMQMGLRIGEICGLQWGDFDFVNETVTIRRTVQRISFEDGHTKVVVQQPKTKTSFRKIPVPSPLIPVLRCLGGELPENVWVLSGNAEKPVEPRCYRKSIRHYLCDAGVRSVNPHMLRHTFASTSLHAGCDVKTLSELLGHSDTSVTLKRYVHTDLSRMRLEMERIFGLKSRSPV